MRCPAALFLLLPGLLAAQGARQDQGRLDPAWFGPAAMLQPSEALGFQWVRPGLTLRGRALRLGPWAPTAWLGSKPAGKDRDFLEGIQPRLTAGLPKGLKGGLKGTLPLATTEGDVLITARVATAVGIADDYMAMGAMSVTVDLKLLDGDSGDLLAAFHATHQGPSPEAVLLQFQGWATELGHLLAGGVEVPAPLPLVQPPAGKALPPPAASAPFDLEGALRRIEGLRRDGLLSEAQCEELRRKAAAMAR